MITIDLTGPDGSAYALMAMASRFAKDLGRDPKPILAEMQSGNYNHLLDVFEREFGEFVELDRGENEE